MEKVIVFKNEDGSCGILYPAPNMFDPASRDRKDLRAEGIDFSDTAQVDLTESLKKIYSHEQKTTEEKLKAQATLELKYTNDSAFVELSNNIVYLSKPTRKSEQEILAWIAKKDVPEGLSYRITDVSNIPTDRTFRGAWTDNNSTDTVDIDMDKARNIHMHRIKEARQKEFTKLGFPNKLSPELEEAIISVETRNKLQKLRDIPQEIDLTAAETAEDLKAIWPESLTERI